MSLYFPDIVEITNIIYDPIYRTKTEGTPFESEAFIEDESEIKYDTNGQPIKPEIFIGLPKKIGIKKGSFIKIIKLHGETPTTQEAERREVKRVSRVGAFEMSHIEAVV